MKTLIVGAGYAGLNAYHLLNADIISDSKEFIFYTAYFRSLIDKNIKFSKELNFIRKEKVIDFDLKSKWIKTDLNEYTPDNLIIAAGCNKNNIISEINNIIKKEKISLTSEDPLSDYITIQLAFYLKRLGKEVSYEGRYMDYLGNNVSSTLRTYMSKYGIKETEKAEDIIPSCKPPYPFDFLKTNEYLMYQNSYIIGDLIKDSPKLGELAMRTGIYVANIIKGKFKEPFKPVFITIIDTTYEGIHIRSDKLWGGHLENVKISKIRQIMKRFIEKYYLWRNGKMGFLYRI